MASAGWPFAAASYAVAYSHSTERSGLLHRGDHQPRLIAVAGRVRFVLAASRDREPQVRSRMPVHVAQRRMERLDGIVNPAELERGVPAPGERGCAVLRAIQAALAGLVDFADRTRQSRPRSRRGRRATRRADNGNRRRGICRSFASDGPARRRPAARCRARCRSRRARRGPSPFRNARMRIAGREKARARKRAAGRRPTAHVRDGTDAASCPARARRPAARLRRASSNFIALVRRNDSVACASASPGSRWIACRACSMPDWSARKFGARVARLIS